MRTPSPSASFQRLARSASVPAQCHLKPITALERADDFSQRQSHLKYAKKRASRVCKFYRSFVGVFACPWRLLKFVLTAGTIDFLSACQVVRVRDNINIDFTPAMLVWQPLYVSLLGYMLILHTESCKKALKLSLHVVSLYGKCRPRPSASSGVVNTLFNISVLQFQIHQLIYLCGLL